MFRLFRTLTSQNQVVLYTQLYVSKFLQTFEKAFEHALFEKLISFSPFITLPKSKIFFISCFWIYLFK